MPAFVNVIVGENYTDNQRTQFLLGLDALNAKAKTDTGCDPSVEGAAAQPPASIWERLDAPRTSRTATGSWSRPRC